MLKSPNTSPSLSISPAYFLFEVSAQRDLFLFYPTQQEMDDVVDLRQHDYDAMLFFHLNVPTDAKLKNISNSFQ